MDIRKRKRINISIAYFIMWIAGLLIYFIFQSLVKVDLLNSVLIIVFETCLVLTLWIFFMIKIDWLKDVTTGKEIYHLNISNILSSLRFILIPLLIVLLGHINDLPANLYMKVIIFIFAVIVCFTDFFDGILARKFNEVTRLGMVIDPFGDFLMITCFSVLLFLKGIITWWFFVFITIRIPALLILMIIFLIVKFRFKLKTSFLGRATIFYTLVLLGLGTLKLFILNMPVLFDQILFYIQIGGCILIVLSSAEKIKLLIDYIKNQSKLKEDNVEL